jgi:hypothetical protein
MFPKVSFNPLNIFDLRKAQAAYQQPAAQAVPVQGNFIQDAISSKYSLAHPRVDNSEGVADESPNGKVLPYLLA